MSNPGVLIGGTFTTSGYVLEPRVGVWHSEVKFIAESTDTPIADSIKIDDNGRATLDFFGDVGFVGTPLLGRAVNDVGRVS